MDIALNFYKDLFAREERVNINLDDNFLSESEKVSNEENELLVAPFSEEEIKEAIFSCYAEGAPGPDGLSFIFYQKFWDIIKGDLVCLRTGSKAIWICLDSILL